MYPLVLTGMNRLMIVVSDGGGENCVYSELLAPEFSDSNRKLMANLTLHHVRKKLHAVVVLCHIR